MKKISSVIIFLLFIISSSFLAFSKSKIKTETYSYYIRLADHGLAPIKGENGFYFKDNEELTQAFSRYGVTGFSSDFLDSKRDTLNRTYKIQFKDIKLITYLKENFSKSYTIVEEVPLLKSVYRPNDYASFFISHPFDYNWHLNMINAQDAWSITRGDPRVLIGVIEVRGSNFNENHEDLKNKYFGLDYWTPSGGSVNPGFHGASVAHMAAGDTDNGIGFSSIGMHTRLYGLEEWRYASVGLVRRGVRIINMSFVLVNHAGYPTSSSVMFDVIQDMVDEGAIIVAGAGNGATQTHATAYHFPASFNNVISVSSVDKNKNHSTNNGTLTHTHNNKVDLVAPGYQLPIVGTGNNYHTWGSGTSLAAPIVSGTIGLMLSANPCLSASDVEHILKTTAQSIDHLPNNLPFQGKLGAGLVQAGAAVAMAQNYQSTNYQPYSLNTNFTYEAYCDSNFQERLRVKGGFNPYTTFHQFNLQDQATNNLIETLYPTNQYQEMYKQDFYTFNTVIDENKTYYIKRGVWDKCQNWQEKRKYGIKYSCIDNQNFGLGYIIIQNCAHGMMIQGDQSKITRVDYKIYSDSGYTQLLQSQSIHSPSYQFFFAPSSSNQNRYVEAKVYFVNGKSRVYRKSRVACY